MILRGAWEVLGVTNVVVVQGMHTKQYEVSVKMPWKKTSFLFSL